MNATHGGRNCDMLIIRFFAGIPKNCIFTFSYFCALHVKRNSGKLRAKAFQVVLLWIDNKKGER